MILRALALAALVALLVGCGSGHHTAAPPVKPKLKPKPMQPKPRLPGPLVVTILDGDRRVRVPGARVTLLGKRVAPTGTA